jgi:homopolymeric O-antigen transport system permease protein
MMNETSAPVVRIRPAQGWGLPDFRDVWLHRDLARFLVWRDLKVRYRQTVLGVLWAVIQPLFTMVVFTVVFGRLAKLPSEGVPYPIFTFAALLPWQLFAAGLSATSNSMVGSAGIVTKVYFPRLVIPIAATLVPLADFTVSSVLLAGLMAWFGVVPTLAIFTFPLFILLGMLSAFASGLWLAAINVRYRDVQHAMPFLVQAWLFASPVAYSLTLVPEEWRLVYALNPMVAVIQGCRWAIAGGEAPWTLLPISIAVIGLLLAGGLVYFRRLEDSFADVI